MEKIKVIKRTDRVSRNIFGKVVKWEYCYYIAKRRFGFLWWPLKFYYHNSTGLKGGPLLADCVTFRYESARCATQFETEADAIRIKLDILQHPDKYLKA